MPVCVSRRKISLEPFVSALTRLLAMEENATYRPSAEMEANLESAFACVPFESTERRVVVPVCVSRRKMSCAPFQSALTRLLACDSNAT